MDKPEQQEQHYTPQQPPVILPEEALAQLSELRRLDLSHRDLHKLSALEWQALGRALARLSKLQQLDLSGNDLHKLSVLGWQALGQALSQLQQLDLSGNDLHSFSDAAWVNLTTLLTQLPTLKRLIIDRNTFSRLYAKPEKYTQLIDMLTNSPQVALFCKGEYAPVLAVNDKVRIYHAVLKDKPLNDTQLLKFLTFIIADVIDGVFFSFILQSKRENLLRLLANVHYHLFNQTNLTHQTIAWLRAQMENREYGLIPHHEALLKRLIEQPDTALVYSVDENQTITQNFSQCDITQAMTWLYEAFSGDPQRATLLQRQPLNDRVLLLWSRIGLQPFVGKTCSPAENAVRIGQIIEESSALVSSAYPEDTSFYWYRVGLHYSTSSHKGIEKILSQPVGAKAKALKDIYQYYLYCGIFNDDLSMYADFEKILAKVKEIENYQHAMATAKMVKLEIPNATPQEIYAAFMQLLQSRDVFKLDGRNYSPQILKDNQEYLHLLLNDYLLTEEEKWQVFEAIRLDSNHGRSKIIAGDAELEQWYQRLEKTHDNHLVFLLEEMLIPWLKSSCNGDLSIKELKQKRDNQTTLNAAERLQLFAHEVLEAIKQYQKEGISFGYKFPEQASYLDTFAMLQHALTMFAANCAIPEEALTTLMNHLQQIKDTLVKETKPRGVMANSAASCFRAALYSRLRGYTAASEIEPYLKAQFKPAEEFGSFESPYKKDDPHNNEYAMKALNFASMLIEGGAIFFPYGLAAFKLLEGVSKVAKTIYEGIEKTHHHVEEHAGLIDAIPRILHIKHFYKELMHHKPDDTRVRNAFIYWSHLLSHVAANSEEKDPLKVCTLFFCELYQPVLARLSQRSAYQLGDMIASLLLRAIMQRDQLINLDEMRFPENSEELLMELNRLLWKDANPSGLDDLPATDKEGNPLGLTLLQIIYPRELQLNINDETTVVPITHTYASNERPDKKIPVRFASEYEVQRLQQISKQTQGKTDPKISFAITEQTALALQGKKLAEAKPSRQDMRALWSTHDREIERLKTDLGSIERWHITIGLLQVLNNRIALLRGDITRVYRQLEIQAKDGKITNEELIKQQERLNFFDGKLSVIGHVLNLIHQGTLTTEPPPLLLNLLESQQMIRSHVERWISAMERNVLRLCKHYNLPDTDSLEICKYYNQSNQILNNTEEDDEQALAVLAQFEIAPIKARRSYRAITSSGKHGFFAGSRQDDIPAEITAESQRLAKEQVRIGPSKIPGWELQDVTANGNCFYEAVIHQMQLQQHDFLGTVPAGMEPHTSLRHRIQGDSFKDGEWAGHEEIIELVRQFNVAIAIVDTRLPESGFVYHYCDEDNRYNHTNSVNELPQDKSIVELAYTGNHYLSVVTMPQDLCRMRAR